MVKHVVLYKLFDGSGEGRKVVMDKLMSMKGAIDVLKDITVGSDFLCSDRSFDICLTCTFENREGLMLYSEHPKHIPVKELMKLAVQRAVSCDYEY